MNGRYERCVDNNYTFKITTPYVLMFIYYTYNTIPLNGALKLTVTGQISS